MKKKANNKDQKLYAYWVNLNIKQNMWNVQLTTQGVETNSPDFESLESHTTLSL